MGNCRSTSSSTPDQEGPRRIRRPATKTTSVTNESVTTNKTVVTTERANASPRTVTRPNAAQSSANKQKVTQKRPKPPPLNAVKPQQQSPQRTTKPIVKAPQPIAKPSDGFRRADPSRWKLSRESFAGAAQYETLGHQELIKGQSIQKGIQTFKGNPSKYIAMTFQTSCLDWPVDQQQYTLIHRDGTSGYKPQGISHSGWVTVLMNNYQRLPPFPNNELPPQSRDKYTDSMTHNRYKLHSKNNPPIMPGRGMGVGDAPNLKIIGDVDPSDIKQGSVGNCWMLSGISSLAEFDGAIKKLFRKTPQLDKRPFDGPNMYTVTLWDLRTWKEVDICVDERLCVMADGSRRLLASQPSEDGELWVCYLEKALAAHCGGWDKITGGQCTHAWALMTGCREQYMIRQGTNGKYACHAKFNPNTGKWSPHANSPHDCDASMWRVAWPKVGLGGSSDRELNQEEMFMQLCAWDEVNYIMGASTEGTSDKHTTGGMVDNHAYSVIECRRNVAGSGIDLIKVRNPWGKGEIEDGMFDDDGPGWDRYPQVKRAINPVVADDGIFWLTRQEFFKIFKTMYLSASNMTQFLED